MRYPGDEEKYHENLRIAMKAILVVGLMVFGMLVFGGVLVR
jgi:hypothetical protein